MFVKIIAKQRHFRRFASLAPPVIFVAFCWRNSPLDGGEFHRSRWRNVSLPGTRSLPSVVAAVGVETRMAVFILGSSCAS